MLVLLVILLCLLPCQVSGATTNKDEMPIIAFGGVPYWCTTEEHFRTFSDCGFTVSIHPYNNVETLVKACHIANKYGVQVMGQCPEMVKEPMRVASQLKHEPGFFGYMMQDEPSVPEIRERQREIERLRQTDSTHAFYINLFPLYNPDWITPSTKAKDYPDYLQALTSTGCQQISFDFYPITTAGVRPTWFQNLEMVRQESIRTGKPFWGFVLSVPHEVPFMADTYYPTPTLAALRLQVYANLAYGAQAIQYFTYWTPNSNNYHYHDAPVDKEGRKTKTYPVVQQMNRELKTVAKLFHGAKVTTVNHLGGTLPLGTSKISQMPSNLKKIKVKGKKGAIISELEKEGHRYLAIVNKDHEGAMVVSIKVRNNQPRRLTKTLQEEKIQGTYHIEAGDILLLRLL